MNPTPLNILSSILSGTDKHSIFPNQAIMYQTVIKLVGNAPDPLFGYSSTDEIILLIKDYLHDLYYNNPIEKYEILHRCVCENILNTPMESTSFNYSIGHNLTYLSKNLDPNLKSNINKTIQNKRKISSSWIIEYQKNFDRLDIILNRIFWLLQYFYVYYSKNEKAVTKSLYVSSSTPYTEYFSLTKIQKKYLSDMLKDKCSPFSPFLESIPPESFSTHILSRIILDVTVAQLELSNHVSLSVLPEQHLWELQPKSYTEQLFEFMYYADAFGQKTLDRFHVLQKYADQNFLAANELGNLYFYGDTMIFGGNNTYTIKPDYKKAIEYYLLAINNSLPPYPAACWSLGYILLCGYCSDENNPDISIQKAKYYFSLAENFPPALNSLTKIMLSEISDNVNSLSFDELTTQYALALEMAYKAASLGWFYGNNLIAQFIMAHQSDCKLLCKIKNKLSFSDSFDIITQLKAACEYDNPWALHRLALEYLKNNNPDSAKTVLLKACDLGYNQAYYTYANNLCSTNDEKMKYLEISSLKGFSIATYDLAKIHRNNHTLALSLLDKAEQQNLSLSNINKQLQQQIISLKNELLS